MKDLIEQLNWRYAVKKYDIAKKVNTADMDKLKEVLRLAPSSFGLQPYKFLFIEDLVLREKLKVASFLHGQLSLLKAGLKVHGLTAVETGDPSESLPGR